MNSKQVESLLEQLWIAKVNQRSTIWENLWARLWFEVNATFNMDENQTVPPSVVTKLIKLWGESVTLKFLCFHSCILRTKKKVSEAEQTLLTCEPWLFKVSEDAAFYLFYEWDNFLVMRRQFPKGLDAALEAARRATQIHQKCWAMTDALIHVENLGLPSETLLRDIESLIESCHEKDFIVSVEQQLKAYRMRQWFRTGQFNNVMNEEVCGKPGQELFYRLWVANLPFQQSTQRVLEVREKIHDFARIDRRFKEKHYRLRTLTGESLPEDLNQVLWSDWADRLYLWCWRWLLLPTQQSYSSLLETLSVFSFSRDLSSLTIEDKLMLRNVLGWLSLFDLSSYRKLRKLRDQIYHRQYDQFPLLRFEDRIINSWSKLLFREEGIEGIADTQFQSSCGDLLLGELLPEYAGAVSPEMQNLRLALIQQQRMNDLTAEKYLIIDLRTNLLIDNKKGDRVVSEPLCRGFEYLSLHPEVKVGEFFKYCFGFNYFDEEAHLRRVFDLLARMRDYLPRSLKLKYRSKAIYAEGTWDGITMLREDQNYFGFVHDVKWQQFLSQASLPLQTQWKADSIDFFNTGESLSWREIAQRIHKPRSTTLKIIQKWIDNGIVVRSGQGRAVRYSLMQRAQS